MKISEYPRQNVATQDDVLLIINDPAGIPATQTITVGNFFANVNCVAAFKQSVTANTLILGDQSTPANSTITVTGGRIWFDANYIYAATANNNVKRAALSSF